MLYGKDLLQIFKSYIAAMLRYVKSECRQPSKSEKG
jgi:hypothetical protein